MHGTDSLRRSARKAALAAATLAAATTMSIGAASAADASMPSAKPYIKVNGSWTTTVGQRTHLVVQYGNKGSKTLENVRYWCNFDLGNDNGPVLQLQRALSAVISSKSRNAVDYDEINYDDYRSPLRAGQNANVEFEGTAKHVGVAKVQCFIEGTEAGTGIYRLDASRRYTIKVRPAR